MDTGKQESLAVLIDYENLALGTGKRNKAGHQKPGPPPDIKLILERLLEKGRISVKKAYCDWQRFPEAVGSLHEMGIELIEIPDRAYTGKNSADIRLSVDAIELCFTRENINTFAILSGDSDFSPAVAKLKEFGKYVIGVGMKESTSPLLVENCDEFVFYGDIVNNNLLPDYEAIVPKERWGCYKLLLETVQALQRENVQPLLASLLKDTMRRKLPQFSESFYGYRSFTALLRDAEKLGLLTLGVDPRSGTAVVEGFCE